MASLLASDIRKSLLDELGLTSSAGIAHSKILAKLIGKTHKPNQQTTIFPTYAEEYLGCKKVREIPGKLIILVFLFLSPVDCTINL